MVEADLAFRGIDLRDLWRRGTGLTLRRLRVLVGALPADSVTWLTLRAEEEEAAKPKSDQIKERQAYYAARGN